MHSIKDKTVKKILLPLGEKELNATDYRILNCVDSLSAQGYYVDILTYNEEIFNKIQERCKNVINVNILIMNREFRFWTMKQRDSFAKTFISLYHDIIVPGTDFKFWKQVAFDDFLWHVTTEIFPKITGKYDLVLFPIPSFEEPPPGTCDVFYTNVFYYAKENNVPIAGLQIFPIYDIPPIFPRIIDYFIVKEDYEKDYYKSIGISEKNIFILEEIKGSYCLSTVEDSYKSLMLNKEISVDKDTLGIVIINHTKNRVQLQEIVNTIAELNIKKSVYFVLRNYSVRDLHENDIFNDYMKPHLEKKLKRFYTVEPGATVKALMSSDVIIATNYILLLGFAGRYNKKGIVYNPLRMEVPQVKDITFTTSREVLRDTILSQYKKKQATLMLDDIIKGILENVKR